MFTIVGKQNLTKDKFIQLLEELGYIESETIVQQIEKMGRATIKNMRVLYVR